MHQRGLKNLQSKQQRALKNRSLGRFLTPVCTCLRLTRKNQRRTKSSFSGWKTVLDKPWDTWNYDASGTPYDYLSIMHYTENAFAKKPSMITIEVHDKRVSCVLWNSIFTRH